MTGNYLIYMIAIPIAAGVLTLAIPEKVRALKEVIALAAMAAVTFLAVMLFKHDLNYSMPWAGFGISLALRLYNFSAFIILAASSLGLLVTLYSAVFMAGRRHSKLFYSSLLMLFAFANGAALSDNLIALLFFWEGLLITMYVMIAIGKSGAFRTAAKMFVIIGISDLMMMAGVAICGRLAGTFTISEMRLPLTGIGGLAFIFLTIGAIAKGGSMPFHTWIPDAATDAPLPFMAIVPAALEKLLGVYFLTRISLDIFILAPGSWASYTLMTIGAITIIFAVMMALIQKEFKRLLSYHAISQLGYMVLGIGTLVPIGIIGGLFHMLNNALYKSCLFLTGGAVERQAGTTDLEKLGGIGRRMPITFACFIIAALSISGVPPFNGFFSKELVYSAALTRGSIFYLAAVVGSFFTAASFLKLGHAAFLGKSRDKSNQATESPIIMLLPMIIIASCCIILGIYNSVPVHVFFEPVLAGRDAMSQGHGASHANVLLVAVSTLVLLGALANHIYGYRKTGSGLHAADHIHYAPGLSIIFDKAEKGYFDPYEITMRMLRAFSGWTFRLDKTIDWIYNVLFVRACAALSAVARRIQGPSFKSYVAWSLVAAAAVVMMMLRS